MYPDYNSFVAPKDCSEEIYDGGIIELSADCSAKKVLAINRPRTGSSDIGNLSLPQVRAYQHVNLFEKFSDTIKVTTSLPITDITNSPENLVKNFRARSNTS